MFTISQQKSRSSGCSNPRKMNYDQWMMSISVRGIFHREGNGVCVDCKAKIKGNNANRNQSKSKCDACSTNIGNRDRIILKNNFIKK